MRHSEGTNVYWQSLSSTFLANGLCSVMDETLHTLHALPVLGVGASLSFGISPDPVALAAKKGGPSFVEYAAPVQASLLTSSIHRLLSSNVPLLYHPSCLNLCGTRENPKHWVEEVRRHVQTAQCAWLAQDVGVCFTNVEGGYSNQLGYFIAPILSEASLDVACERVLEVKALLDKPLLLEPPPVTFNVGDQKIFPWLNALAQRTQCGLLLDAGHVVAHQLAAQQGAHEIDYLAGLSEIDFERVVEIHIAGGAMQISGDGEKVYVDAHDLPILPETWQVFRFLIEHSTSLKAVCVECEGTLTQSVLPMLEQTRRRVEVGSSNPALQEKARQELHGSSS
ncbi:MAG: DUF692 family protein [Deltaproteobacteria bacterium]|nr:DUF692 family protein [Deltaproteobacteria bacterium]